MAVMGVYGLFESLGADWGYVFPSVRYPAIVATDQALEAGSVHLLAPGVKSPQRRQDVRTSSTACKTWLGPGSSLLTTLD